MDGFWKYLAGNDKGFSKRRMGMEFSLMKCAGWGKLFAARAHGMWTYKSRQGRNAATVVCSASAVVTLVLIYFGTWSAECGLEQKSTGFRTLHNKLQRF